MSKFCVHCGKPLEFENAEICPNCGIRLKDPPNTSEIPNSILAMVLSFFICGWGQWYCGKSREGWLFFGPYFGIFLVMIFGKIESMVLVLLWLVLIGIWVYGLYDIYKTTEKFKNGDESYTGKSPWFWLPLVLIVLVVIGNIGRS